METLIEVWAVEIMQLFSQLLRSWTEFFYHGLLWYPINILSNFRKEHCSKQFLLFPNLLELGGQGRSLLPKAVTQINCLNVEAIQPKVISRQSGGNKHHSRYKSARFSYRKTSGCTVGKQGLSECCNTQFLGH